MKILICLSTQEVLDMSFEARMKRAEAMGFDITKVWYHGSLKHFDSFDAKKSGNGAFNFSIEKGFAEQYASTKSMDNGLDAETIVKDFLLPKKLFDYRNKEHLTKLASVLPKKLSIHGRYGWAAWGEAIEYSKSQLLDAIQGIGWSYVGVDKSERDKIRNGSKSFIKESATEVVINYDKESDVVEYTSLHYMQSINSAESKVNILKQMKEEGQGGSNIDFLIWEAAREYEKAKKNVKTYKLKLTQVKEYNHENWSVIESPELRPFFIRLGFEGALMTENKKLNCTVFRPNRIRSVNATFDLKKRTSTNVMA